MDANPRAPGGRAPMSGARLTGVVAVALLAAFALWLVLRAGDESGSAPTSTVALGPTGASAAELRALASDVGHPLYWLGRRGDTTYELTRTSSGLVYVRYLPRGVPVGVKRRDYTIVGTYPVPDATKVLENLAKKPREKRLSVPESGIAVYDRRRPTNVYVAYPRSDLEIEVFDPSPERARKLVSSGRLEPVD